ncbi:thioesterase family protein [Streptacidiphilus sp. ASG 303]|uniref:thioesterase family protein n=1 Tax=Streptacidiphilus sp. ASG 303 TaxID=2896847 RepID=UPI001E446511|nr:thioesterase family protein [Streptacidiphilus sp. ASG 303]MCD0481092.1 thioesterase family protein [Streptacidiphilus sp. ASG 303]
MSEPDSDAEAFFERVAEDRFRPTLLTRGPWSPHTQHAGPPAALLGRAVQDRPGAREDMRLARVTFDILRPVPIRPLTVETRLLRQGRGTELVEASLRPDGEAEVMRATALRIRTEPGAHPAVAPGPALPGPGEAEPEPFYPVPWETGYHTAVECRFAAGSFLGRGPATCWMRMRVPLVAGEKTSPLERVLVAADSGNGVSNVLDFASHVFVNPDLTVHLHRHPVGEWVCLDARTGVDDAGLGMAEAALHDERGPIGRSVQSLFVTRR